MKLIVWTDNSGVWSIQQLFEGNEEWFQKRNFTSYIINPDALGPHASDTERAAYEYMAMPDDEIYSGLNALPPIIRRVGAKQ